MKSGEKNRPVRNVQNGQCSVRLHGIGYDPLFLCVCDDLRSEAVFALPAGCGQRQMAGNALFQADRNGLSQP